MSPTVAPPNRPPFLLPFPEGAKIELKTYVGHNPDDKKIDMYRFGMKTGSPIVASAGGVVHEWFDPGGLEIRHGDGWFTTYMHMSKRIAVGSHVRRGDWIGTMGSVGTHAPHLHYEQLFNPFSNEDGETDNMVNPVLQGQGPLFMDPKHPITMVSTNKPDLTADTRTFAPQLFWVDTFDDAPVFKSPKAKVAVGTLKRGRNYVYGRRIGREVRVGPNFNHFWLRTDPDEGRGHWVSAFYLTKWGNDEAKDNEGLDLPDL
jgi:Peptidase family M23